MKKNRVDRSARRTRGMKRMIHRMDFRKYVCKEVRENIQNAMRDSAKSIWGDILHFDLNNEIIARECRKMNKISYKGEIYKEKAPTINESIMCRCEIKFEE